MSKKNDPCVVQHRQVENEETCYIFDVTNTHERMEKGIHISGTQSNLLLAEREGGYACLPCQFLQKKRLDIASLFCHTRCSCPVLWLFSSFNFTTSQTQKKYTQGNNNSWPNMVHPQQERSTTCLINLFPLHGPEAHAMPYYTLSSQCVLLNSKEQKSKPAAAFAITSKSGNNTNPQQSARTALPKHISTINRARLLPVRG